MENVASLLLLVALVLATIELFRTRRRPSLLAKADKWFSFVVPAAVFMCLVVLFVPQEHPAVLLFAFALFALGLLIGYVLI